jgi:hypothetical protein
LLLKANGHEALAAYLMSKGAVAGSVLQQQQHSQVKGKEETDDEDDEEEEEEEAKTQAHHSGQYQLQPLDELHSHVLEERADAAQCLESPADMTRMDQLPLQQQQQQQQQQHSPQSSSSLAALASILSPPQQHQVDRLCDV